MNRYTFKAKRRDNNEWIYGCLSYTPTEKPKDEFIIFGITKDSWGNWAEIILETLCQCTGIQDKNGNYIFENDIIDINQTVNGCNLFKIVWDKHKWNAEYYAKMKYPRLYEYSFEELLDINDYEKDILIVGNKFDN